MKYADYDLEIEKAVQKIQESEAKKVLVQLPDGLKAMGGKIVDELKEKTGANCYVFMGACYGACDFPTGLDKLGFDLLIAWGHSEWRY